MDYTSRMPQWLLPVGRIFFAIGVVGIGVQHFIFSDFIPVIVPAWPAWIPGHYFWPYVFGAALSAAGLAIIFKIKARTVATLLGAAFLLLLIFDHIPAQLAASPAHLGVWTNALKALTLCGGAWIVASSLTEASANHNGILERLKALSRYFLPITVVAFGVDHFLYPAFVASLVPKWIPGPVFWTYFAGVALIASGVAIIVNVQARLAALMLGTMIFLWFIMLHIPRAIADPHTGNGNEWTSVCEALAFSGIAFMLAALPSSNRISILPE
jgi:uncharacterized membrane protein